MIWFIENYVLKQYELSLVLASFVGFYLNSMLLTFERSAVVFFAKAWTFNLFITFPVLLGITEYFKF